MGRIVTLRIKKKWFDLIWSGAKRYEFRSNSPYNVNLLLSEPVSFLYLHYQGQRSLIARVKQITLRSRKDNDPIQNDPLIEIQLGKIYHSSDLIN